MGKKGRATPWRRRPSEDRPRDLIRLTLPGPCSNADVVRAVAGLCQVSGAHLVTRASKEAGLQVGDPLPDSLNRFHHLLGWPGGRCEEFISASEVLDWVAGLQDDLHWAVIEGVLRFEIRSTPLSPFDELAGQLLSEAALGENGRYSDQQYAEILEALDRANLPPLKFLRPAARSELREYNQKHQRTALKSWQSVWNSQFRRDAQLRFDDAKRAYRVVHRVRTDRRTEPRIEQRDGYRLKFDDGPSVFVDAKEFQVWLELRGLKPGVDFMTRLHQLQDFIGESSGRVRDWDATGSQD